MRLLLQLATEARWRAGSAGGTPATGTIGSAGTGSDVDDLIHLRGPLTEDAVVRALQARFYHNKFYVSAQFVLGENVSRNRRSTI